LHIDHRSSASVAQIRTQCRRMRATGGLDMVIVDYLQLVSPEGRHGNREQEVASMSRAFKQLAGEMEVPVLLLSQLNRGPAASTDGRPHLYSLRESGSLEQDADAVMLLYRPSDHGLTNIQTGPTANDTEPAEGLVELILAKNRNGPTLSMWLDWHAPTTCFREHVRRTYAPGGGEAREEEFGL
jgi:replicative DNA helicase